MAILLRILRDEWVERVFRDGRYYTGLRRRWRRGLEVFFLKKTEVGDSVIGYGVVDSFFRKSDWLKMGGEPHDEHPWRDVLTFKQIERFSRPVPVKELGIDKRFRGMYLHGYIIDEATSGRILALAGLRANKVSDIVAQP